MNKIRGSFWLFLISVCVFLGSCVSDGFNSSSPDFAGSDSDTYRQTRKNLVDSAYWAKGRTDVSCNGRKFAMDCSGVISAIYWRAGIDLQSCYPRYTGGGVARIYQWLDDESLLYKPNEPMPGDIIFWDNSYDKNGNGKADDTLTHIGMVVSVDDAGVVTYVHNDYLSGIIFAHMFPPDPSDRSRNSGMRIKSLGPAPGGKITSGDLYRCAGQAWRLAEE